MVHANASNPRENSRSYPPTLVDHLVLVNGFSYLQSSGPLNHCFLFVWQVCFVAHQANLHVSHSMLSLPIIVHSIRSGVPNITVSISPAIFYVVPLSFIVQKLFQQPSVASSGSILPWVGIDSVCPWEKVISGSTQAATQDSSSCNSIIKFLKYYKNILKYCLPIQTSGSFMVLCW